VVGANSLLLVAKKTDRIEAPLIDCGQCTLGKLLVTVGIEERENKLTLNNEMWQRKLLLPKPH
jgi:hypothetical protein